MTLVAGADERALETLGALDTLSVAVAMPAYDEEGLPDFVLEIEAALRPVVGHLAFVVVDDASPRPVEVPATLEADIEVVVNPHNRGHGPSALIAYASALGSAPDVVLHVDGDGQFHGTDLPRVLAGLARADVAMGVRRGRREPWFRRVVTRGLRVLVSGPTDVNTPLRAYRAAALRRLLDEVAVDSLIPHVHFSRLHRTHRLATREVAVSWRPRLGDSPTGTSWGTMSAVVPSRRFVRFVLRAALELRAGRG